MTPVDAMREIAARQISLTSAFDGRIWSASIERVKRKRLFTKPDMEVISATASTPAGAVRALIARLDGKPEQQALIEEYV